MTTNHNKKNTLKNVTIVVASTAAFIDDLLNKLLMV